jgi:hypothetical protein
MWKLFFSALGIGLSACANAGPAVSDTALADFQAYRAAALAERDEGRLSPVEAQERIEV